MYNSTLKIFVTIIIICSASLISKAQIGYNYSQFDVGFAGSFDRVYGDSQSENLIHHTGHASLTYNQTPFLNYVLDFQAGKLAGGSQQYDSRGRQFVNRFEAVSGKVQLQAGELMDYSQSAVANALKNLYLSTGVGLVVNNVTAIRQSEIEPGLYTPGEDKSNEIFIPARIGYEFKIFNSYDEPTVKIDLSYQYNFVMGDELDGFTAGGNNDGFSQVSLGVKFAIGSNTSYRKQISF